MDLKLFNDSCGDFFYSRNLSSKTDVTFFENSKLPKWKWSKVALRYSYLMSLFSFHTIKYYLLLIKMSTHHLLTIAEILTEGLINLIEQESENEDDLFTRLGRNHRAYALHNHRQRLDFASLDGDLCKLLFRFTYVEIKKRIA
ncbi:hypothetical protein BD770DRAFT_408176 [Pilaira anomala]|nr:hypothetical protein BD770DRAFT_408176 [Pilaira anomala]